MNKYLLIIASMLVLLTSCGASGNSVIATGANLSQYEYAIIPTDVTGDGTLHMETLNVINEIGKTRLKNIPLSDVYKYDKSKILSVHIAVSQSHIESVVTADFRDYLTDNPVISLKGRFGEGWSMQGDMNGALGALRKQLQKYFGTK